MEYKKANKKDVKFLLKFYNDSLIQEKGLNIKNEIILENNILDTINYFEEEYLDMLILIDNNDFIGLLMIYEKNKIKDYCKIGISFIKEFRYKNLFVKALRLAEEIVYNYGYSKIVGEIDENNKYVIKKILNYGFYPVEDNRNKKKKFQIDRKILIFEKKLKGVIL
ncbi:MAG: hypothetical protein Q4B52_04000 [Tissierellia bacterium]|nr:hypothetical protein [Tissierellia bacterium]